MKKSLSTRTHSCPHCGHIDDRDANAAINILMKALQGLAQLPMGSRKVTSGKRMTRAEGGKPTSSKSARRTRKSQE